jgi:hypothetical protein
MVNRAYHKRGICYEDAYILDLVSGEVVDGVKMESLTQRQVAYRLDLSEADVERALKRIRNTRDRLDKAADAAYRERLIRERQEGAPQIPPLPKLAKRGRMAPRSAEDSPSVGFSGAGVTRPRKRQG